VNGTPHLDGDTPYRRPLDWTTDSEGRPHSSHDQPAITWPRHEWFHHGTHHRDHDQPAIINPTTGEQQWWQHGQRHRDHGPAWARPNHFEQWWRHGQRHRDHDQPAATYGREAEGGPGQEWWTDGRLHRATAPAIIRRPPTATRRIRWQFTKTSTPAWEWWWHHQQAPDTLSALLDAAWTAPPHTSPTIDRLLDAADHEQKTTPHATTWIASVLAAHPPHLLTPHHHVLCALLAA
jgi:hypothetical protein